jgi:GT2 family glycosyltransferase
MTNPIQPTHFVFIAVNYNGAEHTHNYLSSIRAMRRAPDDLVQTIIVDNASLDQDVANVREFISASSNETLIERNTNDGYFKGLNAGIKASRKDFRSFVIVGNNDLTFAVDFIENLKKIKLDPDIQVIAPNVVTLDGRRQNPHVLVKVPTLERVKTRIYFSNYYLGQTLRFINTIFKSFRPKPRNLTIAPAYGEIRIKRGIGACYVLTPAFFKAHVQLDDRVFLWGEEALLSHQVENSGGATLYAPSLGIIHCESASVKFIESRKRYDIVKQSYQIYRDYL